MAFGTVYFYKVTAVNAGGESTMSNEASAQPYFSSHVHFNSDATEMPAGYIADTGLAYGSRVNGLTYGWNQDNTPTARDRDAANSPDELHDGLIHMQKPSNPNASWKIAVPNGTYSVHLIAGDPSNIDSVYKINVQSVLAISGTPTSTTRWFENTVSVSVTNGFLVISNATGSANNKLNVIDIKQTGEVHLVIAQQPSDTTAGQAISPAVTVQLLDESGNLVTSDNSDVSVTVATGPGTFTGGSTLTATASGGIATFDNLVINTAGSYMLQVTEGTLDAVTSAAFNVNPAQADHLVIAQQPSDTTAGQAMTSDSSNVSVAIATGPDTFTTGSTQTVTASGGIATFDNLVITTAGNYTLQVTDGSLTSATSQPFNINAGQPDHLVFLQQPSDTIVGQVIPAVTVEVVDPFGNLVTSDNSTVSVAIATGPGAFTNGSTLTVTVSGGIATIDNLAIDTAGSYTLVVTDGSLTGAISDPFNIKPA